MPLNQRALIVISQLAYHDYEGIALNLDEQKRLIADLGGKIMMLLRNHGTLAFGSTPGEAFRRIHDLENACTVQIRTLSAGREHVLLAPETARREVSRQIIRQPIPLEGAIPPDQLIWQAALRKVKRAFPGFDK